MRKGLVEIDLEIESKKNVIILLNESIERCNKEIVKYQIGSEDYNFLMDQINQKEAIIDRLNLGIPQLKKDKSEAEAEVAKLES